MCKNVTPIPRLFRGAPLLLALILATALAEAQSASTDRAAAQTLFDDAMKLMSAKRYVDACPKLEESQRIDPGMGTQYNLAECYEKTGKTASAWLNFTEVADGALKEGSTKREQIARQRANAVQQHLSYITVVVPHPVPGLIVKRDGTEVRAGSWGTAIPVDPGTHVIEVTAPNKAPWKTQLVLRPDGAKLEALVPELQDTAATPTAAPQPGSASISSHAPAQPVRQRDASPTEASTSSQKSWAVVSAGLGVVGIGVGTAMLLSAMKTHSDAAEYCDGNDVCNDSRGIKLLDEAKDRANLATVPVVIGVVGLGLGATLWFTAPTGQESNRMSAGLSATPNGVVLHGKF